MPTAGGIVPGRAAAGDGALEAVEVTDGQAGPGLAVGGVREIQAAERTERPDRGVAVQDLPQEEIGRHDGREAALPVGPVQVGAEALDQGLGDHVGEVALEAFQSVRDTKHKGLLAVKMRRHLHHGRRPSLSLRQRKARPKKRLRLS